MTNHSMTIRLEKRNASEGSPRGTVTLLSQNVQVEQKKKSQSSWWVISQKRENKELSFLRFFVLLFGVLLKPIRVSASGLLVLSLLINPVAVAYADEVITPDGVTSIGTAPSVISSDEEIATSTDEMLPLVPLVEPLVGIDASSTTAVEELVQESSSTTTPPIPITEEVQVAPAEGEIPTLTQPLEGEISDVSLATTTPELFASSTLSSSNIDALLTSSTSPLSEASDTTNESRILPTEMETIDPVAEFSAPEEIPSSISAIQNELALRAEIRKQVESELRKGCVTLDSVGYYCLENPESASVNSVYAIGFSGVSIVRDSLGGDTEISVIENGKARLLTNNAWDDSFPARDAFGSSVVWQGSPSGRSQVYYAGNDLGTTSMQVTYGDTNHQNPQVDGRVVVWQEWLDGNWEIVIGKYDHVSTSTYERGMLYDPHWTVSRITRSPEHDMFPKIGGGMVTWQAFVDGDWHVFVYDVATGRTTKLSEGDAKHENPRFAILWDERVGDTTRLIGHDLATGMDVDLTAEARTGMETPLPQIPVSPAPERGAALPLTSGTSTSTGKSQDSGDGNGGIL